MENCTTSLFVESCKKIRYDEKNIHKLLHNVDATKEAVAYGIQLVMNNINSCNIERFQDFFRMLKEDLFTNEIESYCKIFSSFGKALDVIPENLHICVVRTIVQILDKILFSYEMRISTNAMHNYFCTFMYEGEYTLVDFAKDIKNIFRSHSNVPFIQDNSLSTSMLVHEHMVYIESRNKTFTWYVQNLTPETGEKILGSIKKVGKNSHTASFCVPESGVILQESLWGGRNEILDYLGIQTDTYKKARRGVNNTVTLFNAIKPLLLQKNIKDITENEIAVALQSHIEEKRAEGLARRNKAKMKKKRRR